MSEKINIPQFDGAAYQAWAFKVRFGLVEKEYHTVVMEMHGKAREPRPVVIEPRTQAALYDMVDDGVRIAAVHARGVLIGIREPEIESWDRKDLLAQTYIVKYLGPTELMHVRRCRFAFEMWDISREFYELQGSIEIANAQALLSGICQSEAENLTAFVRREEHENLDTLGEPVSKERQATNLINSVDSRYTPMIRTIQTWASTAPQLYTVQQILSTLQQDDVREEVNMRKRGEPLSGRMPLMLCH